MLRQVIVWEGSRNGLYDLFSRVVFVVEYVV